MACRFDIIASGLDEQYTEDVVTAALEEIHRLDEMLSAFNPTSELSFLNAEAAVRPVIVSPDLFRLLVIARQVCEETGGAFDVTTGPLIKLWRQAEQTAKERCEEALESALEKVGMSRVHLDESINAVRFDTAGVEINLGGIGKGFAVQRAVEMLKEYGIESGMVSGGGSTVSAIGNSAEGRSWRIGIRHPSNLNERVDAVTLRDRALSHSGGVEQKDPNFEEKSEHIIDPATGRPVVPSVVSATVMADDAALADALSTAVYLRGRKLAEEYASAHPSVGIILVERVGDEDELRVCRFGGGTRDD